ESRAKLALKYLRGLVRASLDGIRVDKKVLDATRVHEEDPVLDHQDVGSVIQCEQRHVNRREVGAREHCEELFRSKAPRRALGTDQNDIRSVHPSSDRVEAPAAVPNACGVQRRGESLAPQLGDDALQTPRSLLLEPLVESAERGSQDLVGLCLIVWMKGHLILRLEIGHDRFQECLKARTSRGINVHVTESRDASSPWATEGRKCRRSD